MKYLAVLALAATSFAVPLSKRQSIVDILDIPGTVEGELETVDVCVNIRRGHSDLANSEQAVVDALAIPETLEEDLDTVDV
jgi:hypothetical protein